MWTRLKGQPHLGHAILMVKRGKATVEAWDDHFCTEITHVTSAHIPLTEARLLMPHRSCPPWGTWPKSLWGPEHLLSWVPIGLLGPPLSPISEMVIFPQVQYTASWKPIHPLMSQFRRNGRVWGLFQEAISITPNLPPVAFYPPPPLSFLPWKIMTTNTHCNCVLDF